MTDPIPIYVDNKAMISISETMKQSNNLKHINTCIEYIRDSVNDRTIKLLTVASEFNVADIHTKCLIGKAYKNHRGKIMHGFNGDPANIHRYMDEYA